jgi:hypothetical protein
MAHVNVVAPFSHHVMNNIYMVSKRISTTITSRFITTQQKVLQTCDLNNLWLDQKKMQQHAQ